MVHFTFSALAALATIYAVFATPVQVASDNAVAERDNTPAPGEPFYNTDTKSIEINRREALASPGEPYYNPDTHSIEIDIPSSGGSHDKRADRPGPGTPGRNTVRIYYDMLGRIRVFATLTATPIVQGAFESFTNELLNVASGVNRDIGYQGQCAVDYTLNQATNTLTVGLNYALSLPMFQATPVILARGLGVANQIAAWARQNNLVDVQIGMITNYNCLTIGLAPGASPASPPPGHEGQSRFKAKMMARQAPQTENPKMMARQASKTDFCTAPIAKSYNLIVDTPDGATTGGAADVVTC